MGGGEDYKEKAEEKEGPGSKMTKEKEGGVGQIFATHQMQCT